jgi:cytochrome c553
MMQHRFPQQTLLLGMALVIGGLTVCSGTVAAGGDAAAGAKKAIFCAYCHGADGNPPDSKTPRLAGQSAKTLVGKMKRLAPYQDMHHPMLQAFVTGGCLNDRDIRNLAAYFSRQPVRQSVKPPSAPPASK